MAVCRSNNGKPDLVSSVASKVVDGNLDAHDLKEMAKSCANLINNGNIEDILNSD